MKIGQLVKKFIPEIINYCEEVDIQEAIRLYDPEYSKRKFNINYPFWVNASSPDFEDRRYWKNKYDLDHNKIRVCNHWYIRNIKPFKDYLIEKNITTSEELEELEIEFEIKSNEKVEKKLKSNSRYRGNAIGNAQNLLIRNILSNLGDEAFSEKDWQDTKKYFDNRCAYCGTEEKLIMEHAIPINKTMLGEHRLGNIVPSCNECNKEKGPKSYDQFLDDEKRLKKIEAYMKSKDYEPLYANSKSEIIAELLEKAYLDAAEVSKRYIQIIELILINKNDRKDI